MALKTTITYIAPPGAMLRAFKAANGPVAKAMEEVGDEWHGKFMPKHFEEGAALKYKYRPRKSKYIIRKRKQYGHNIDLVFSGNMKRMVTQMHTTKGTSTKVTVRMNAPRYAFVSYNDHGKGAAARLFSYGTNNTRPAEEMTRLLKVEAEDLAKSLNVAVTGQLNNMKEREVVKIG